MRRGENVKKVSGTGILPVIRSGKQAMTVKKRQWLM
jgi:hypothetical protein